MTTPIPVPKRSVVRTGSFRLGGVAPDYADATDFSVGNRAITVKPMSSKKGDDIEFLDGAKLAAESEDGFTVEGKSIQMFDAPDSFQAFCHAHNGEQMHFEFRPNPNGLVISGELVIQALPEGGNVGPDAGDVDFSFRGVGFYDRTYTPPVGGA